jgi:uncharacterized membrane protein (DUF2068 family)
VPEQDDAGLRLIIAWKCVKLTALVSAAVVLLGPTGDRALPTIHGFAALLHVAPEWLARYLTPRTIRWGAAGMIVLGAIYGLQAFGLHRRRAWGDWLTLVPTSLLVPVELYRIVRAPHLPAVAVLVVNLCIVAYLARRVYRARCRLNSDI